jgi:SAM-dependent methyltransferase
MYEVIAKTYGRLRDIPTDVKRKSDFRCAQQVLLASGDLAASEKRLVQRLPLKVHRADSMHVQGYALDYLSAGLSAARCIQAALHSAGKGDAVGAILDFPCGYGRVLRFLRAMFPDSDITGGEIQTAALDFCQREFSVTPFLSSTDFTSLSLSGKFDVIWCGSLITHIDEQTTADLLRLFYRHLSDRGICIFTTHGQRFAQKIKDKKQTYGLSEKGQEKVLCEFQEKGYGYANYINRSGYGISAASHSRVIELARSVGTWQQVCYLEHGWDHIQDVYAFAMHTPTDSVKQDFKPLTLPSYT